MDPLGLGPRAQGPIGPKWALGPRAQGPRAQMGPLGPGPKGPGPIGPGPKGPGPRARARGPGPDLRMNPFSEFRLFFSKITIFMKTKKNRGEIPVIFPLVSRPNLFYVSESRGFGFY